MAKNWQNMDLGAGGIQQINLQFLQQRKKLGTAIAFWCLLPFSAHRWYLRHFKLAGLQYLLLVVGIVLFAASQTLALLTLGCLITWFAIDLFKLPNLVSDYNKQLRLRLYQQQSNGPSTQFTQRFDQQDDQSHVTTQHNQRIPSFAEQEALLKQLQQKEKTTED